MATLNGFHYQNTWRPVPATQPMLEGLLSDGIFGDIVDTVPWL